MTITIELTQDVEAELARQAASRGRDVETYAASLLEEAINRSPEGGLRQGLLDNTLREMAEYSDRIPALPDQAFTRESLYRDYD